MHKFAPTDTSSFWRSHLVRAAFAPRLTISDIYTQPVFLLQSPNCTNNEIKFGGFVFVRVDLSSMSSFGFHVFQSCLLTSMWVACVSSILFHHFRTSIIYVLKAIRNVRFHIYIKLDEPEDNVTSVRPFKIDKVIQNFLNMKTKRQGLGSLTSKTRFSSLLWNTMWKKLQLESRKRDLFTLILAFLWVFSLSFQGGKTSFRVRAWHASDTA